MMIYKYILFISFGALLISSCVRQTPLEYALSQAGDNRQELESVLEHYKDDPEKHSAATFLIENMPAHISYQGADIDRYYEIAMDLLLQKDLDHVIIRDSLLNVREKLYPNIGRNVVSDIKVMKSDYLIYTIDHAFRLWGDTEKSVSTKQQKKPYHEMKIHLRFYEKHNFIYT